MTTIESAGRGSGEKFEPHFDFGAASTLPVWSGFLNVLREALGRKK
jgi:hypothetical protein